MSKLRLGYVGTGLMGQPMIRHLIPKGYGITANDISDDRQAEARAAGATVVATAGEVAAGADVVVLNLPTVAAVEDVVFRTGNLAQQMQPGQVLVDFSTIPVAEGKAFAQRLMDEAGCGWVDAPVSGGPPAAATGTLTIMIGGRPEDVAVVQPFLTDVGQRITIMGGPGAGLAAKMINQLIVGCGNAVMAEALMLAESLGIDAARMPECLAGGHADSTLLQQIYPRMAARDFAPRGYARQMLKDLEMVSVLAGQTKTATPMMAEALQLFRLAVHLGHAEQDTSAVVNVYDRQPDHPTTGRKGR